MNLRETTRYRRGNLPHWEVSGARYFITVRCADSLPSEAVSRIQELHRAASAIEPRSPEFSAFQRALFRTLDKYLDAGSGACPLRNFIAADIIVEELTSLAEWHVAVPHFTIMPNHWHALLAPPNEDTNFPSLTLSEIMKRIKGRTATRIRKTLGGVGPFWQREWFDRWIRDDAEWDRCVTYIRNNPVKAGLARQWQEHAWTR